MLVEAKVDVVPGMAADVLELALTLRILVLDVCGVLVTDVVNGGELLAVVPAADDVVEALVLFVVIVISGGAVVVEITGVD